MTHEDEALEFPLNSPTLYARHPREDEAYSAGRLAGFKEGLREGDELRAVVEEWADLCNDYDLNETGQAVMVRLRAILAATVRR